MFDAVDLNGAVLGRLTPGTNYLLTVAAINEAGTGMSSQTAVGVTESRKYMCTCVMLYMWGLIIPVANTVCGCCCCCCCYYCCCCCQSI